MSGISRLQAEGLASGSVYLVVPSLVPLLDISSEQNDQRWSQDQAVKIMRNGLCSHTLVCNAADEAECQISNQYSLVSRT